MIDVEKKIMINRREGKGGKNWKIAIDLIRTPYIAQEVLYSVMAYMGNESKKE